LRKASRLALGEDEDSEYFSNFLWLFCTSMPVFRRQDLLRRTAFLMGGNAGIWKQARELVVMSKPKSAAPLILPADIATKGDISLRSMQTPLCSRLSRMSHRRLIKDERKLQKLRNFSLCANSHQTGDAALTPVKLQDFQHSRAKTDSHNSHNTQHTRVETKKLCFM
jgi:hypothetical protein